MRALIPVITTGNMAMQGLADLGEAAVPDVLALLDSNYAGVRSSAARTLGKIADQRVQLAIPTPLIQAIRSGLLRATRDRDPYVRSSAIMALASYDDSELRKAMESIMQADTFAVLREGRQVFPVRENARAWLDVRR